MRNTILAAVLVACAVPVTAQTVIRTQPRPAIAQSIVSNADPNRAMLGISTSSSGRRDTLGLLVTSVTAGSPAEKAGIEEGNRLVSINGVSLRLSREDADDDYMQGVNQNRLTREMRKVKAGDEVSLEVYGGGRSRNVKVKTVTAEDLSPKRAGTWASRDDNRAAIGLFLTTTGSKRDTVGVFVQQVVDGGPADKAGIVEGDRIASINGVDLRVPREDAGDWSVSSSRVDRLEREVGKLTVGQSADLVVVSGGRSRTVKVAAVKATDLPGGYSYSFRAGPQGGFRFGGPTGSGTITIPPGAMRDMPRIRIRRGAEDFENHFDMKDFEKNMKDFEFSMKDFGRDFGRDFGKNFRGFDRDFNFDFDNNFTFDFDHDFKFNFDHDMERMGEELKFLGPRIRAEVRDDIERDLPRLREELRDLGPRIRAEIDDAIRDGRMRKYDGRTIIEPVKLKTKIGTSM
jgi:type II secretory pathway component PulC